MREIIVQTAIYILTMALGYGLKRVGIFKSEDKKVLTNLILYVTLPAALVSGFTGVQVDRWFLAAFLFGAVVNGLMVLSGIIAGRHKKPEMKAIYTINCQGFNMGNIAIPFLQNFFPAGIPYLCMFDVADACFTLGATYSVACIQLGKVQGSRLKNMVKGLLKSVPFDVYMIMTVLSLLNISLPDEANQLIGFLGQGNACMAMLLVGISLEIKITKEEVWDVVHIIVTRYLVGAAAAAVMYFLIPAPLVMRQVLTVAMFSAVPNIALIYSSKLGVRTAVASALNPISTLMAIPVMAVFVMLVQ